MINDNPIWMHTKKNQEDPQIQHSKDDLKLISWCEEQFPPCLTAHRKSEYEEWNIMVSPLGATNFVLFCTKEVSLGFYP